MIAGWERGQTGLMNTVRSLLEGQADLTGCEAALLDSVVDRLTVEEETRAALWNGEAWVADYRRLRVVAHI